MAALLGKKVLIMAGKDRGNEGYVVNECADAITIKAPALVGVVAWYGHWYARKEMVKVTA